MIVANGTLTQCQILRAPEVEHPRHTAELPVCGFVERRPAETVTCHVSATSPAMSTLSRLAQSSILPTCYITTMWPLAKVQRTTTGKWKTVAAARQGGPSRSYRTKSLACRARDKMGVGMSRTGPLTMMSVEFDGGVDLIESSEFGPIMAARPTRVCAIRLCFR